MSQKNTFYPFLELNLSFILMSTSGILGKVIPLAPAVTIFLRCLMAGLLLVAWLRIRKSSRINWSSDRWFFLGSGILLALHWTTYFEAIKVGGVAIAMLSLFTYPVITSVLEPWFFRTRHSWFNILSSLVVLGGLLVIVPEFSWSNQAMVGTIIGVGSAVLYSIRNILNKRYIKIYSGTEIMCYQLLVAAVVLLPVLWFYPLKIDATTWAYLLVLVIVTTAIAHTLFVQGLVHFTTSSVSIMSSLTPVYGILWAVWLTDERITREILFGGMIILAATIAQNVQYYRKRNHVTGDL